ncbi:heparinase II/III family protein [Laribacter hongkongensis]|uniref:heparinase II/III family protein n=1 Tax=Laribacter hongkongensis TaxID=168471 RepID=UPI001EFDFD2B|nr:heparinase II/III family protein [Laribacter hongkongensis]MCG8992301.1 heparinase II/III family protein [Laribacter hongkongensis]MCG8999060.1 heparinase II/III family protein [Laribacter hongkongensis]MCG9001725.1 heparinase II/III family protein [Laribacter hongkongensis]MCG9004997.1 heparinase II/III family protein [Laribacter hongkongensis]MCG9007217.1 heparinase II/III family protein [Laribacter hongkongensis]
MKLRARLALYFHTLRYLKPVQVWGRVAFRLRSPQPDLRPAPAPRGLVAGWCAPIPREQSQLAEGRFRFLNAEHEIASAEDWNSQVLEKLWLYNLHYFDDLNARCAETRRSWHLKLLSRWIAENPPGVGVGWEPYPISLRVVNWIKWCLAGNEPSEVVRHSLAVQLRFLSRRLEVHLLGNHLFANAKALIFGGLFLEGSEAERWYASGKEIMGCQLGEQILADGGHFERSPMYHSLLLEDLLDLRNLHCAYGKPMDASWRETIAKMSAWLRAMTHPDGEIAFFNDAASGIAPKVHELADYARRLGMESSLPLLIRSGLLPDSGFARIENKDVVIMADIGSVGPDYLPGHAHAGTLSFELSLAGRRVLVNSGTSVYGNGVERQRQRGTAAHNTLRVDECDSSEVWSGFRVARRARTFDVRYDDVALSGRHDGYRRLPGKPIHYRQWTIVRNGVDIVDELAGSGPHLAELFFHIHPDWRPHLKGDAVCELVSVDGSCCLLMRLEPRMAWRIEPSTWHPQFGVSLPNFRLVGSQQAELPLRFVTRLSRPCVSCS